MLTLQPFVLLHVFLVGVVSAAPTTAASGKVFIPAINESIDAELANTAVNAIAYLREQSSFPADLISEDVKKSYSPAIHLASAAYYSPQDLTPSWKCPRDCQNGSTPSFRVEATGGGLAPTFGSLFGGLPYFVGFNPGPQNISLAGVNGGNGTVVVSFRGTSQFTTLFSNGASALASPSSRNFNGTGSTVQVHLGFQDAFLQTAEEVIAAVQSSLRKNGATTVLITGHSQGAAVALYQAVALRNRLPKNIVISVIGLAMPRTGNSAWADYVDSVKLNVLNHIGNGLDAIPVTPPTDGRIVDNVPFLGPIISPVIPGFLNPQQLYSQVSGEIHIDSQSVALGPRNWYSCRGRDNVDAARKCASAAVGDKTVRQALNSENFKFHTGPYIDTCMGQACPGR